MANLDSTFTGELWLYGGDAPWVFVTLPTDLAEEIRERVPEPGGFGSVRVTVSIGDSEWQTSVFPDKGSGSFVLPIKKEVRRAEGIAPGDTVNLSLQVALD